MQLRPGPPRRGRVIQPLRQLGLAPQPRRRAARLAMVKREDQVLTSPHSEAPDR